MADATTKLSGYLTTAATCLTTELNSLADNGHSALGAEIDNSTNKYTLADFEMYLASAAFTGTDSGVELYIVPSLDGTNYPTWTTGTADEQENTPYYVGFFPTTGTTAVQRAVLRAVPLPQGKWKPAVRSRANVALPSSGNTISWRPHSYLADEA
jgi:hypothetical protein